MQSIKIENFIFLYEMEWELGRYYDGMLEHEDFTVTTTHQNLSDIFLV